MNFIKVELKFSYLCTLSPFSILMSLDIIIVQEFDITYTSYNIIYFLAEFIFIIENMFQFKTGFKFKMEFRLYFYTAFRL